MARASGEHVFVGGEAGKGRDCFASPYMPCFWQGFSPPPTPPAPPSATLLAVRFSDQAVNPADRWRRTGNSHLSLWSEKEQAWPTQIGALVATTPSSIRVACRSIIPQ